MPHVKFHRIIGAPYSFKTRCGIPLGTMRDSSSKALVPDPRAVPVLDDSQMARCAPEWRCGRCQGSWDAETVEILRSVATPPPSVR